MKADSNKMLKPIGVVLHTHKQLVMPKEGQLLLKRGCAIVLAAPELSWHGHRFCLGGDQTFYIGRVNAMATESAPRDPCVCLNTAWPLQTYRKPPGTPADVVL